MSEQASLAGKQPTEAVELLTTQNTVEFDEAGLADASISGDRQAFEALYTHYFPKVRGFCLRKLGNADLAEDIAQEAFARAFERIADFGGPKHFGGWVGTIASNLCTDFLRRKKNLPVPLEDNDSGPAYDVDPIRNLQREDTGRLVRLALDKLEPRHREALLLHEVKGMSCAAVGQRLGISEVAAESLLARARRRLRREITAKAAPADLFGLGGLGLLPALVRAWRRAREGVSRRTASVQAAASRSWDGVSGSLVPSLDAAKALVVVAGVALAAGGAGIASNDATASGQQTATTAYAAATGSVLPADGDLGLLGPARRGFDSPITARAKVDPSGTVEGVIEGDSSHGNPAANTAPTLKHHVDFYFGDEGVIFNARARVNDPYGLGNADTGDIAFEQPLS